MNQSNVKKLAVAGLLCALAVVGSMFIVFPVFGSKCAPTLSPDAGHAAGGTFAGHREL